MQVRPDDILLQIRAHTGRDADERLALSAIDGFTSAEEVAYALKMGWSAFQAVACQLGQIGVLTSLQDWSLLHWCHACGLPVLDSRCGLCGGALPQTITLRSPSNPALLDRHHAEVLRGLGVRTSANAVVNRFVHGRDRGFEVVDGELIGEAVFDEVTLRWRFAPTKVLPRVIAGEGDRGDLTRILAANAQRLAALTADAVELIAQQIDAYEAEPLVYFSGGKDSSVILHLTLHALRKLGGRKFRLLYLNTGVDYPGTEDFVHRVVGTLRNVELIEHDDKDMFWRAMDRLGPPAEESLWCCPLLKSTPLNPIIRWAYGGRRYLAIEGSRHREGAERLLWQAGDGRFVNGEYHPNELRMRPIWRWTDFDVWLYLRANDVPYHPAYDSGAQRITCYVCPVHDNSEFHRFREMMPERWNEFEERLEGWRRALGFPPEWVSHFLWRRDLPSSEFARKLGIRSRRTAIGEGLSRMSLQKPVQTPLGWLVRAQGDHALPLQPVAAFLRAFVQEASASAGQAAFIDGVLRGRLDESGRVDFEGPERDALVRRARELSDLLNIFLNCIGCQACEEYCESIRVEAGRIAVAASCTQCRRCAGLAQICPVSQAKFMSIANLLRKYG